MLRQFRYQIIEDLNTPIKSTFYYRKQPDKDWRRCGLGWGNNTPKYWMEVFKNVEFAKRTSKPRFKTPLKYPHGY